MHTPLKNFEENGFNGEELKKRLPGGGVGVGLGEGKTFSTFILRKLRKKNLILRHIPPRFNSSLEIKDQFFFL